jgi:hypothetical protein
VSCSCSVAGSSAVAQDTRHPLRADARHCVARSNVAIHATPCPSFGARNPLRPIGPRGERLRAIARCRVYRLRLHALRLGCRLLAPWLGQSPALYLRSLTQRHPRRPPDDCPMRGGCTVFLAIGRVVAAAPRPSLMSSCLSWAAAR